MTQANKIQHWLIQRVADVAQLPTAEINCQTAIASYGLDSSTLLQIVCDLEDWLSIEIDPSILQQHDSIEALSQYLVSQIPATEN